MSNSSSCGIFECKNFTQECNCRRMQESSYITALHAASSYDVNAEECNIQEYFYRNANAGYCKIMSYNNTALCAASSL